MCRHTLVTTHWCVCLTGRHVSFWFWPLPWKVFFPVEVAQQFRAHPYNFHRIPITFIFSSKFSNDIQPCFSFWPSVSWLKLGVFLFGQILLKFRAMSSGFDNLNSKNPGIKSSSYMITSKPFKGNSNYLAWSFSIVVQGAGVQVHLKKKAGELDGKTKTQWKKVDAQVCSILWQSIDFKLMFLLCPLQTCSIWEKACALSTNDGSRFYDVIF